ncbi:MAG: PAS domain S-box protein [bacterium]|nr:PAS domain S-box protein [bacterium]
MKKVNLEEVIVDLRKSLAWLDLVLATLKEGVLTVEKDWSIHFANDAISGMLGKNKVILLGLPLWEALPLSQNGKLLKKTDYTHALTKNNIQSLSGIYTLSQINRAMVVDVAFCYIPKIKQIVIVVRDVTKLQQETRFVRLHQEIATAANESNTFEEAMSTSLKLICTSTNWPIGHVYYVNEVDELIPTNIWHMKNPRKFTVFRKGTESRKFKRGEGLPGRVLASRKPAWISNITNDINFPRSKLAQESGIKAGIAFPVLIKKEVVAILEFFSIDSIEPSESLLHVMSNIGAQLGRVIERSRSEEGRLKLTREQTARAEAEVARQQIQLSEIRHRTMIEQSPLSIQILSPKGLTLQVNKAWEALWGVTLEQIEGYNTLKDKQLIDLGIMPYIKKGFNGESTIIPAVKYEPNKTIKDITGVSARWVRAFIYPVKDGKGKIQEIVLIHEDITQQKQNEEKLKQSEERFRTLIEQSTDAIQLISPEGEILYTSDSIKNVLGYSPKELLGLGVSPFMHPDDLHYFSKKVEELLKQPGGEITLQYRVKHKDGSWAWIETTGVNHLKTPNINALVGTFRNITERKKYEGELRYQKTLLEAQREVSPEGVLIVSPDGKMLSYNSRFVQMWQFSEELMFKGEDELALKAATQQLVDPEAFIQLVHQIYKNHQIDFTELRFKDGRIFDRYGSPIIGEDGTDYGYVWFFQDVTERKRLERQKDEFISIASHELKTPVTSIKSFGQVLQIRFQKEGNEKAVELLGKMNAQIDKLTNLIGDLLDVTKIETGRVEYNNSYFPFDDLITELVEEMQRTTEKHTLIQVGKTMKKIYADRDRIGQVLTNLISNAIKYSPLNDKIIVRSSIENGQIKVSVQDFGVGIPNEKFEKVFERFFRISGPGKDTYPGLGLGLYISSEIIKRQGGRIWVESQTGKGSIFSFILPIKTGSEHSK